MKNLFEKIGIWWKHSAKYYHYDVYYGIQNLIVWSKLIWNDREFDSKYILRILQFKLKRNVKYFNECLDHEFAYVGMESDIRYMRICIKLIDYILDGYYETKASDMIDETWGESHFDFVKEDGKHILNITYDKVHTDADAKQQSDDSFRLMHEASLMQDKANRLLYLILQNRLNHWWI